MKVKQRVYVMAPYTDGDTILNVREAINLGELVIRKGGIPFVPHLFHFWHFHESHAKSFWMTIDKQMMFACHSIITAISPSRLTEGMQEEVEWNKQTGLNLPIYQFKDVIARGFKFVEVEV